MSAAREIVTVAFDAADPSPAVTVSVEVPTGAAVTVIVPFPVPPAGEKASPGSEPVTLHDVSEVTEIRLVPAGSNVRVSGDTFRAATSEAAARVTVAKREAVVPETGLTPKRRVVPAGISRIRNAALPDPEAGSTLTPEVSGSQ